MLLYTRVTPEILFLEMCFMFVVVYDMFCLLVFVFTCVRFELVQSPEMTLCGWRRYTDSINNNICNNNNNNNNNNLFCVQTASKGIVYSLAVKSTPRSGSGSWKRVRYSLVQLDQFSPFCGRAFINLSLEIISKFNLNALAASVFKFNFPKIILLQV